MRSGRSEEELPHPSQAVATFGYCRDSLGSRGRACERPVIPVARPGVETTTGAEGWEPVGLGRWGMGVLARSSLVAPTVAAGVCGSH